MNFFHLNSPCPHPAEGEGPQSGLVGTWLQPTTRSILSLGALTQIQYLIQLVCHWDLFTCEKHPDFSMFKISFSTEASVKTSQVVVKLINSQEHEYLILPQVCENCWIQVWWDDYQRGMPKLISIFLVEVIMHRGKSNPQKYKPGSRTLLRWPCSPSPLRGWKTTGEKTEGFKMLLILFETSCEHCRLWSSVCI